MVRSIKQQDGSGIVSQVMTITPELAKEWLSKNVNNRRLSAAVIDRLAVMIERGLWQLSHQGIAFYEDDTLADGQHRLSAIAKAGKPVQSMVVYGLKKESNGIIDQGGRVRTLADNLQFEGKAVPSWQMSTYRTLYQEYRRQQTENSVWDSTPPNTHDFALFCEAMKGAVDFAIPTRPRRDLGNSQVFGAVAAAWFTKDRDRLKEYLSVYITGICPDAGDHPAILMNRYILARRVDGSVAGRLEVFRKACCSVRNFLTRTQIVNLQPGRESFPIPKVSGI
jgi:hypothetical protein